MYESLRHNSRTKVGMHAQIVRHSSHSKTERSDIYLNMACTLFVGSNELDSDFRAAAVFRQQSKQTGDTGTTLLAHI